MWVLLRFGKTLKQNSGSHTNSVIDKNRILWSLFQTCKIFPSDKNSSTQRVQKHDLPNTGKLSILGLSAKDKKQQTPMSNCLSFINIHVIKAGILETSLDYASDFSLRQNDILDCERISAGGIFLARKTWRGSTREVLNFFLFENVRRDLIVNYGKCYKGNR